MGKTDWLEQCADVLIEHGCIPYFAMVCALLYQRDNFLDDEDLIEIEPGKAAIEILGGNSARAFH